MNSTIDETAARLEAYIQEFTSKFPKLWKGINRLFEIYSGTEWPNWCFVPQGYIGPCMAEAARAENKVVNTLDIARVTALAPWRLSKGIYKFDNTLFDELINSKIDGDIPATALMRLPQWCVYVLTPGLIWEVSGSKKVEVDGFLAHLNTDDKAQKHELIILLDVRGAEKINLERRSMSINLGEGKKNILFPMAFDLGSDISKSIEDSRNAFISKRNIDEGAISNQDDDLIAQFYYKCLSLLLFLCSQQDYPEGEMPTNSKPVTFKKFTSFVPANKAKVWDVGVRIGPKILNGKKKVEERERVFNAENGSEPTERRLRPHMRKAHWHNYATGPRNAEKRPYLARWIPPQMINMDEADILPVVVHPVEIRASEESD